jgi:formamidopyrimidine-DNA glycosylase
MPELPEVEYTARQLRVSVVGATIDDALVFWERTIRHPDTSLFLNQIAGHRIEGVRRRGKYLILDLDNAHFLSIHRRMTGNLLLLPPGWGIDTSLREEDLDAWNTKGPSIFNGTEQSNVESSYCRVCFNFSDGRRLLYTDPRKFGHIELWPCADEEDVFGELGLEPLSDEFTVERLATILTKWKGPIKQVLLVQEVVAGIGNIYADEALYDAGIHPLRRANSLTPAEVERLRAGIVSVLTLGIEHGGTSFTDYRDLWGESGDNYSHLRVYDQKGELCQRCNSIIERIVVAQRGTHFCPGCQNQKTERLTGE